MDTSLTEFVEISQRSDLFESIDNETVLRLSRHGEGDGFRNASAVQRATGVVSRRVLRSGVEPLDLAVAVAKTLQERLDLDWHSCPCLCLSHSHVDEGAAERLALRLADRLRLPAERIIPFNSGCTGFLEVLKTARSRLHQSPPDARIPLLFVETPDTWHDASDRKFCGIIGTGAAATTLQRGAGHRLLTLVHGNRRVLNGESLERPLFRTDRRSAMTFAGHREQRDVMTMDAGAVFHHGLEAMLEECKLGLGCCGEGPQRRIVVPHQPSGKMLRALVDTSREMRGPVPILENLSEFGNMLSASIPTLLARLDDVLARHDLPPAVPGDRLILVTAGISMQHRAGHLARGHAVIEW